MSDAPASSPTLTAFALGRVDISHSFLALLPDNVRQAATTALAFRLLAKLWSQYRIDRGINHGRTLFSIDNGVELRLFTSLIDEIALWNPLRAANALVRQHSPALSVSERASFDAQIDEQLELAREIGDQLGRVSLDLTPVDRINLLIDRSHKLEDLYENGVCWALNLVCAMHLNPLASSTALPPFPTLLRRELFRIDRSKAWRRSELERHLAVSAQDMSASIMALFHGFSAFLSAFPSLRQNSRLPTAFAFLTGVQEVSPLTLSRLLDCTEPGARKMLRQMASAGFAIQHPPAPAYVATESYRLSWPRASWLWVAQGNSAPPSLTFVDE